MATPAYFKITKDMIDESRKRIIIRPVNSLRYKTFSKLYSLWQRKELTLREFNYLSAKLYG